MESRCYATSQQISAVSATDFSAFQRSRSTWLTVFCFWKIQIFVFLLHLLSPDLLCALGWTRLDTRWVKRARSLASVESSDFVTATSAALYIWRTCSVAQARMLPVELGVWNRFFSWWEIFGPFLCHIPAQIPSASAKPLLELELWSGAHSCNFTKRAGSPTEPGAVDLSHDPSEVWPSYRSWKRKLVRSSKSH